MRAAELLLESARRAVGTTVVRAPCSVRGCRAGSVAGDARNKEEKPHKVKDQEDIGPSLTQDIQYGLL